MYASHRRAAAVAAAVVGLGCPATAGADIRGTLFEPPVFAAGPANPSGAFNAADGWKQAAAGFDHAIVVNTPALASVFGLQSLRISNAHTTRGFSDQTFSAPVVDSAGEKGSQTRGLAGGVRRSRFVASLRFASAGLNPAQQPGLAVQISPDNGLGGRMGLLGIRDEPNGLKLFWQDAVPEGSDSFEFPQHTVAENLSRTQTHLVVIALSLKDGPNNDVAKISVDGGRAFTGTTWETYYRRGENTPPPRVDSLLFATRDAAPGGLAAGGGLLFDDVRVSTPVITGSSTDVVPAPSPSGGGGGGGTSGGGNTQTPTTDGAADTAPLQIRSASLNRRTGKVRLQMFCPRAAGLCAGTATIRANRQNLTSKGFDQNGGARFSLTINLSESARSRLRGASSAQGLVLSRDAMGIATRVTRTFRF